MKRRNFLNTLFPISLGIGLSQCKSVDFIRSSGRNILQRGSFSVDGNKISYFLNEVSAPLKIIQIADTHLWMDDKRGEPFLQYSERMAKAYNKTRHFSTGEITNPSRSFEETLKLAVKKNADLLVLTGDIFSFPSEAAIEWAYEKLNDVGIPYLYIAGNHDWHYEGMEGNSQSLRETWTKKRLNMLYQDNNPLMASYKVKGINVLVIDNSTFEILPEQLEFLRDYANRETPFILMMHIPLYAPGRPSGCGNPGWGAKSDTGYKLERRERWPEDGHSKVTLDFHDEVFSSPNLLGVFAGHTHQQSVDLVGGIPQFVTDANATGAFLEIVF